MECACEVDRAPNTRRRTSRAASGGGGGRSGDGGGESDDLLERCSSCDRALDDGGGGRRAATRSSYGDDGDGTSDDASRECNATADAATIGLLLDVSSSGANAPANDGHDRREGGDVLPVGGGGGHIFDPNEGGGGRRRAVLGDRSKAAANDVRRMSESKASLPVGPRSTEHARGSSAKIDDFRPRTKSARRKNRRVESPSNDVSTCSSDKRIRTSVQFFVPALDVDRRHFGFIEGLGGGEEESERGHILPHRGRMIELPGRVMPGKWEALVLNDSSVVGESNDGDNRELRSLRISLRHIGTSSNPLEAYYRDEKTSPDGTIVSLLNPSVNRVSSFVKQGIFTDDEIDFSVENEERMSSDSSMFVGCISLVTFGGFACVSESINDADDCSKAMLSACACPNDERLDRRMLRKIVHGENESDVTGILFPCKIDFEYNYSFLLLHDDRFQVAAIDVIFRTPMTPITTSLARRCLTESILSEHVNNVGSGIGEIAARYAEQEKRLCEIRDYLSLRQLNINRVKSDAVDTSIAIGESGHEDDLKDKNGRTKSMESMNQCAESDCEARNIRESKTLQDEQPGTYEPNIYIPENVDENPVTSELEDVKGKTEIFQDESVLSNRMREAKKQDRFKTPIVEADTVLANGDTTEKSASLNDFADTFVRDGTSAPLGGDEFLREGASSCSLSLYNATMSQDGEGVRHNDLIDKDNVRIDAGRGREQKKTLTTEYEDFEKRRQISKYLLLKENIINEAVVASRRCEEARRRWSNDSCSARSHAVHTLVQQIASRRSFPSTMDTRTVLETNTVEETEDTVAAADLHESKNVLHRNTSELKIGATMTHLRPSTAKKRLATSIDLSSSIKKRKMAVVADLFGETDSLFGCKIIEPPGTRNKQLSAKTPNKTMNGSQSKTPAINFFREEPKRVDKKQHDQQKSHSAVARENRMRQSSANPDSIEHLYSFQRLHSSQVILFRQDKDENNTATKGEGLSRRSNRARQQTTFFHSNVFEAEIHDVYDNNDDVSNSDRAAVRPKSSRSAAFRAEKKYSADSIAQLQKSSRLTGSKGIQEMRCRDICQQLPRCSTPDTHSLTATAGKDEMVVERKGHSNNDDIHNQGYTAEIHENCDIADWNSDALIANTAGGASCSFESYNEEIYASSVQPSFDVYFDEQSAAQHSLQMLQNSSNESQHLHDVYFGQESVADIDDEADQTRLPIHSVYFGLDDAHSLAESQLGSISLAEPTAETPFHDSYFGQETYYEEVTGSILNESEVVRARIPRCTFRSKPLLVMALLAGMLSRAL